MSPTRTTVVIPTLARPSLRVLLAALASGSTRLDCPVLVVDDQSGAGDADLAAQLGAVDLADLRVVPAGGGGPARARNLGWRRADTDWVSFLDDDVLPDRDWYSLLLEDLDAASSDVAGSQGRVHVPIPEHRRPTDWERGTAGLAEAVWITADLSYRRSALSAVGGFDERFPRAFREDADLGLRVTSSCGRIERGTRSVTHRVRPVDGWVSVRQQRGNQDDFLMRRLHGPDWRKRVHAPQGRRTRHLATATSAASAAAAALTGHHRAAAVAAVGWLAGTAELATRRILPGPRDAAEVSRMLTTSVMLPFAATWHSARGAWRHRHAVAWRGLPDAVLLDRDGTLVHDVPYNGDPALVRPVAGASEAVDRLRAAGVRLGVVTNQSGIAAGRITSDAADAVNARIEALLGPFGTWQVCPHARHAGCTCRKPAPGMVKAACTELGVEPSRCVVIGDIGSDVEAAQAAGAVGILVPTPLTRLAEVIGAPRVCPDLPAAVDDLFAGRW